MEYKLIEPGCPEESTCCKIYEEAFPPEEKDMPLSDLINYSKSFDELEVICAKDEGRVVGFYCILNFERYIYLLFFAVDGRIRGGGYGTKILTHLLYSRGNRDIIGLIETPTEKAPNNEQRLKRKSFYERLGLPMSDVQIEFNGLYNVICTTIGPNLQTDFNQILSKIKEAYPKP